MKRLRYLAKMQCNVSKYIGIEADELGTEVDLPLVEICGGASLGLELGDELVELAAATVRMELGEIDEISFSVRVLC